MTVTTMAGHWSKSTILKIRNCALPLRQCDLLLQRMNAVIALSATLILHLFSKVVMQETPTARRTLPVLHHSLQLLFILLNFRLRHAREVFEFVLLYVNL